MFKYDPLYRLLQATGRESTNQSSSYTWNEVNPISVSDNALNCRAYTQRYEYDKNGRITRMKHTANANNYTRKYNYTTGNNRLASVDNGQSVPTVLSAFSYDNNGNQITTNSERHYEYDAGDMMRAYYNQTSAGVEPTVYAHYVYSGGARTKKLVRTASNEYESVVYLGPFEYHKKVTASTTEEKNYTNVIGGIEIRTGSFTGDISDTVVYSLGDHLGSVSTRVNESRIIIDKEEYYPYGDSAMRTTDKKRYRYTGKEKDAESKLYYYGARYYTAWACTFTSVDPAAGSTHYQSSYNYADCNPIVMNDPTGMQAEGTETKVAGAAPNNVKSGTDSDAIWDRLLESLETPEIAFNLHGTRIYNITKRDSGWDYADWDENTCDWIFKCLDPDTKENNYNVFSAVHKDVYNTRMAFEGEKKFVLNYINQMQGLSAPAPPGKEEQNLLDLATKGREIYWGYCFSSRSEAHPGSLMGVPLRSHNGSLQPFNIDVDVILFLYTGGLSFTLGLFRGAVRAGTSGLSNLGRTVATSMGRQMPSNLIDNAIEETVETSFYLNRHGQLTNGVYTVSTEAMVKHTVGNVYGKSVFYSSINANEAVLKAAQYADEMGLWVGNKAKVPVLNTNIGILGNGTPTNVINVYRNSKGFIHGSPGTPR